VKETSSVRVVRRNRAGAAIGCSDFSTNRTFIWTSWVACLVQRDAGDSAERAGLRSSPDCQAEDALFAARSLQAQHLLLSAPLFAVVATT
jgi:hypothetical protein